MSKTPLSQSGRIVNAQLPTFSAQQESDAPFLRPANPGLDFFTPQQWVAIGEALDLSARELAVLVLIFEGHTREAIARRLHRADGNCVSVDTVRVFINRLFEKANVDDKVGLILRVVRIHRLLAET